MWGGGVKPATLETLSVKTEFMSKKDRNKIFGEFIII